VEQLVLSIKKQRLRRQPLLFDAGVFKSLKEKRRKRCIACGVLASTPTFELPSKSKRKPAKRLRFEKEEQQNERALTSDAEHKKSEQAI